MTVREQELPVPGSAPAESADEPAPRRRRVRRLLVGVVGVLLAVVALAVWRANVVDTDGDGLTDRVETTGWQTTAGALYRTDPGRADTDGDGLTDRDEAGTEATTADGSDVYAGYSDPRVTDSDRDGLNDGHEADAGLDPRDKDVDDDGLLDGYEVDVLGTDPQSADTDGDGFTDAYEDGNRDSQGLDPLTVDVQVSRASYVTDFLKGALAGDLLREDSLAWLAGNLAAGASSSVLGPFGTAADLRDALGSAIHGDWVGSGFSLVGALPGGDTAALPRKVARFLADHPRLLVEAARMIARQALPHAVKVLVARAIWPDWDALVRAGAHESWLLRLEEGRTDLRRLGAAVRRHAGTVPAPVRSARLGELALQKRYDAATTGVDRQVRFSTAGCTAGCDGGVRVVDVLKDGVAHESKVGWVAFSESARRQIRKDAWLLSRHLVSKVVWHFAMSEVTSTIGADPRVTDLLDQLGIDYEVDLPADTAEPAGQATGSG